MCSIDFMFPILFHRLASDSCLKPENRLAGRMMYTITRKADEKSLFNSFQKIEFL